MTTLTDKELIKEIKERISSLDVRDNIERRAYEIALASLEAEPVAWKVTFTQIDREYNTFTGMYSDKAEVERWVRLHKACNFRADITPLYTAKPVPVTPDSWVMVPKTVTQELSNAINVVGQRCTCGNCSQRLWDLLLAAAPQREAK
ncbi:hypothetical protein VXS30_10840 [Escherichia coli]|uniref:hypothetical protein n=1 Tax=Escherichia coli TaxID=562 RepID=UPI002E1835F9|nr:hypothetical protein [Escherichia coli]